MEPEEIRKRARCILEETRGQIDFEGYGDDVESTVEVICFIAEKHFSVDHTLRILRDAEKAIPFVVKF